MDKQTLALTSAIGIVVAAAIVPGLFEKSAGFGSLAVGIAAFISLQWFITYRGGGRLSN